MAQVCIGAFRFRSPEVISGGRRCYCTEPACSRIDFPHLSFSSITYGSSPKLKISVRHPLIRSALKYPLTISAGDASFRYVRSGTLRHASFRPTLEALGG